MAQTVYALCALTSLLCAVLLVRSHRAKRSALLLWSAVSFCGLFLNNLLLFMDLVMVPEMDLALVRSVTAVVSLTLLVWGLITVSVGKRQT